MASLGSELDFLGRHVVTAGLNDFRDFLGRPIVDPSPEPGGETDYLGRLLVAGSAGELMDPDDLLHLAGAPFTDEEVDGAVAAIRAAAGWHIAPTRQDTVMLTVGCRETMLRLPTRKLVSVDEVRNVDLSTVIAEADYRPLVTLNKLLKRRGYWPTGYEALEVDMTHGYSSWPADLLPVVAEAAATSRRDQTVRSQTAGVFTVAYGAVDTGIGTLISTSAALDRYLLDQPGMA